MLLVESLWVYITDHCAHHWRTVTYLDKDVTLGPRSSIEVDNLGTQAGRSASIHFPARVRETLSNRQVLRRKTITSSQSQGASQVAH